MWIQGMDSHVDTGTDRFMSGFARGYRLTCRFWCGFWPRFWPRFCMDSIRILTWIYSGVDPKARREDRKMKRLELRGWRSMSCGNLFLLAIAIKKGNEKRGRL